MDYVENIDTLIYPEGKNETVIITVTSPNMFKESELIRVSAPFTMAYITLELLIKYTNWTEISQSYKGIQGCD